MDLMAITIINQITCITILWVINITICLNLLFLLTLQILHVFVYFIIPVETIGNGQKFVGQTKKILEKMR
jgi:hypothetical protein